MMEYFREILILFAVLNFLGVHGCGTLKATSAFVENTIVGQIRLYPSPEWETLIKGKYYQWTKGDGSPTIVGYFLNGYFTTYPPHDNRLADREHTLVITGMKQSDVDVYRVECFSESRKDFNRTEGVRLRLPNQIAVDSTTRTTEPSTSASVIPGESGTESGSGSGSGSGGDAGEVSIVIVMTVVIVGLVVVIFGLVIRMKVKSRRKGQLDRRAIAKEEETQPSSDDNPHTGENVYNEIDEYAVIDPDITYAQVKNTQASSSQGNIPTLGVSPSLPRRDQETSRSVLDVRMTSQLQVGADKCIQRAASLQDVYATVLPKELRDCAGDGTNPPTMTVEQMLEEESGHMKKGIKKPQRSTIKKGGFQYKSMDCILTNTDGDMGHEYSNTVHTLPRSIKRKGSKSKTELMYIQIDHGRRASTSADYAEIEPVVIGEAPSSEYVSIDFEKKAFVAPIRKAPSSWYRKRKERKEKKKALK